MCRQISPHSSSLLGLLHRTLQVTALTKSGEAGGIKHKASTAFGVNKRTRQYVKPFGPRTRTVSRPGPAPCVSTKSSLTNVASRPHLRPGPLTRTLLASVGEVTLRLNGDPTNNQSELSTSWRVKIVICCHSQISRRLCLHLLAFNFFYDTIR